MLMKRSLPASLNHTSNRKTLGLPFADAVKPLRVSGLGVGERLTRASRIEYPWFIPYIPYYCLYAA